MAELATRPSHDFMDSALDVLGRAGYFGVAIPQQFGGGGGSTLECCAVQARLAQVDAGLAIGLNMHLFSTGVILEEWRLKQDLSWALLEAIATQRRLIASAFAEPGLGGSLLRSTCRARRVDKGYVVNGVKTPCSIAERSDLVCLQMLADDTEDNLLVALIPTKSQGASVSRTWSAMGMAHSESDTLKLENVFVPEELVFYRTRAGEDNDPVFTWSLCWFAVTAVAVYIGLASKALDLASAHLAAAHYSGGDRVRASYPEFQASLGSAVDRYLLLVNACKSVARAMDERLDPPEVVLASALSLRASAVEIARMLGDLSELCGGMSYGTRSPLAALWRDAQAILYHPPTRLVCHQMLGRLALHKPMYYELVGRTDDACG
ncbi:acyl-CoA/acyl-ACP dehydrogenase [Aquabacterium sp. A7-Y]|uniref:acyl-CoA dehydrogenase family protein n=1 Tax=Aquabacterium sp. A7-Y TaxID=1349605 RepID=UPI00223D329D|nr:acyl-CoA dehydrogenase family protein [Aquabacterium sp. A7-Y]MCW7536776.1 acyl-CoA/acyl-ACP dehydrogenase [Aquabacterium sp. A7-Y]